MSDFYATVSSIKPWISSDSTYFNLSDEEIYIRLAERYLRPQSKIVQKVDAFYRSHMVGRNWISVHVRGSDKIHESPDLWEDNAQYFKYIDKIVELNPEIGIFLLTDSAQVCEEYRARYGGRLLVTEALRAEGEIGIHSQHHNRRTVGEEVLIDVLIAMRGNYFIGNKESNVSVAIATLRRWPSNFIFLLGAANIRSENWALHAGHISVDIPLGTAYQLPKSERIGNSALDHVALESSSVSKRRIAIDGVFFKFGVSVIHC